VKTFPDFRRGIGFGGWLTNYKRFNVLPPAWRERLTVGDFEHFRTYLAESDAENAAAMGFDHVRVGFDQRVLEERPGAFREEILDLLDRFCGWFESRGLGVVLNLHKAVGNYCDIHEENALLDDPALQDRFVALWEAVTRRFAHRPAVAFELLNEPRTSVLLDKGMSLPEAADSLNSLLKETVDVIRESNPTRYILWPLAEVSCCYVLTWGNFRLVDLPKKSLE
jgi:aryl-phospho-beta-D-glucosidase BglC (GH1 family)